jgi:hypothetical protein
MGRGDEHAARDAVQVEFQDAGEVTLPHYRLAKR